jgi:hypothetical protein
MWAGGSLACPHIHSPVSGRQLARRLIAARQEQGRLVQDGDGLPDVDWLMGRRECGDGVEEGVDFLAQAARIGVLLQVFQDLAWFSRDGLDGASPGEGGLGGIRAALEVWALALAGDQGLLDGNKL